MMIAFLLASTLSIAAPQAALISLNLSDNTIIWIVGGILLAIQGLLVYIFHTHSKRDEETRQMIIDHILLCAETPNKLILDRIMLLGVSLDTKHVENKDTVVRLTTDVSMLRDRVSEQSGELRTLTRLVNVGGPVTPALRG